MKLHVDQAPSAVAGIKRDTGRRIERRYPDWKQRNLQMDAILLLNKKVNALLAELAIDPLTASEKIREAQLVSIADWIKRQREYSDQMEKGISEQGRVLGVEWPE